MFDNQDEIELELEQLKKNDLSYVGSWDDENPVFTLYVDDEETALYANGELYSHGDTLQIYEELFERLGVKIHEGDEFKVQEGSPAQSLEDIHDYQLDRIEALEQASDLLKQAKTLIYGDEHD